MLLLMDDFLIMNVMELAAAAYQLAVLHVTMDLKEEARHP